MKGASETSVTISMKISDRSARSSAKTSPAPTETRNSRAVMPEYFDPMAMPMKNCAAQTISAGGRWWISPARLSAAVRISGPRIAAPKIRSRSAIFQPSGPATSMIAVSNTGMSASRSPGGRFRSAP